MKVVKYACSHGVTNAIRFFEKEFPNLTKITVRPLSGNTKKKLRKSQCVIISQTRGRPLLFPAELDEKLRLFITNIRTAGGSINKHVIYGVLMGLIKADMTRYGGYLDFTVTKGWLQSLYSRMNMSRRMVTTSRPIVTSSLWKEVRTQFHNDIASAVLKYNIPDKLILNIDQTPSKYVPTENVTMAETGSKHVSRKGGNDKRGITVTLSEAITGKILPFQLIYTGETARSLPSVEFTNGFCLNCNPKHWSNEDETINLLESVVDPYFCQVREKLGLQNYQKALILWDAFKAQSTDKVTKELERLNIVQVMVPKNMTHLLQPLDASVKKMKKKCFSEYFTNAITKEMLRDPKRDVTTIEVDLSTLKPEHAKVMRKVYEFLQSEKGCDVIKAGWRPAGITDVLKEARDTGCTSMNPFSL